MVRLFYVLIIKLIFVLPLCLDAQQSFADTVFFPSREYTFFYSSGITSKTRFSPVEGPLIFQEKRNSAMNVGLLTSWYANSNLRIESGLGLRMYDFEFRYSMKQSDFPDEPLLANGDLNSYYTAYFHKDYDLYGLEIPIMLSGRLLGHKHSLWLSAGIGMHFFIPSEISSTSSMQIDSLTDYTLYDCTYKTNPRNLFIPSYKLGLAYSYSLPNHHKINMGLVFQLNTANLIEGKYLSLMQSPLYSGKGHFSSGLDYLGLEVSYSINNQRRREQRMRAGKRTGSDKPSNDVPADKWELRLPLEMIHYKSLHIPSAGGGVRPVYTPEGDFNLRFNPTLMRYLKPNKALYTGAGYNILVYNAVIRYDTSNIFRQGEKINLPISYVSQFVRLPLGLMLSKPLTNNFSFEAGGDVGINISTYSNNTGVMQLGVTDKHSNTTVWLYTQESSHVKRVFPSLSMSAGFSRNLKNHDRLAVHFHALYTLGWHGRHNYVVLQEDGSQVSGVVTISPRLFNMSLAYCFTWKNKRWLKGVNNMPK